MSSAGSTTPAKPKLVFFRQPPGDRAQYILVHLQEHVKCLSHFFDVVLVASDDCDYKLVCETHKPDLALFESGVYAVSRKHRRIRNTDAFPEIPKLGLCNADAYCESRELFLSDMYEWNVDAFFTISVSMAEYTPEIADRLFVWPNFADNALYKDYGERKNIPVLFTGSVASNYPWRNRIYKRLSHRYPSLLCPHLGWGTQASTAGMIYGEQYARLLNASIFVPACGTIANELVRKHFEIPASRACLVAPRTPAMEAAGFVDMQNCVFAEAEDVIDKLDYLFSHTDELERITSAGHTLANSAHTLKHRDQLYQWFILHKRLAADEQIVQPGPFQPLMIARKGLEIRNSHIAVNGVDRRMLQMGDEKLHAGRYEEARGLFLNCLNYHNMPEAKLRLVMTNLLAGNPAAARHWSLQLIQSTLETQGASTPDPVDWAYFILTELCNGKVHDAAKWASSFLSLRHPELDRARLIVYIATGLGEAALTTAAERRIRYSVHRMHGLSLNDWISNVRRMLKACGQSQIVERIDAAANKGGSQEHSFAASEQSGGGGGASIRNSTFVGVSTVLAASRPKWLLRYRHYLGSVCKGFLHSVEARFGYFLPYEVSTAKFDDLFRAIETLSRQEDTTTVFLIGARVGSYVTEACLRGVRYNPNRPIVVCSNSRKTEFARLQKRYFNGSNVRIESNLTAPVSRISKGDSVGLIIIDGPETSSGDYRHEEISRAGIVVVTAINNSSARELHQALMASCQYVLLDHNPRNAGYAIFKRIDAERRDGPLHFVSANL